MIVPFEKRHLSQIAEIERLCFSDPWSENALEESIRSPYSHFFVYEEEGVAVGYMGLYAVAGEGSVTNVATHPDHRKKGIGKALVDNALEVGRSLGLEYMTLEVRLSNEPAQRLYEKCGFQTVGTRRNFYSSPKEDAIIMNYFFDKE